MEKRWKKTPGIATEVPRQCHGISVACKSRSLRSLVPPPYVRRCAPDSGARLKMRCAQKPRMQSKQGKPIDPAMFGLYFKMTSY